MTQTGGNYFTATNEYTIGCLDDESRNEDAI